MNYLKSWNHKLYIVRTLNGRDWLILIEAWARMLFYRTALLVANYERLEKSFSSVKMPVRNESSALADAERLGTLIRYAAQIHLPPINCLPRSLVLKKMLAARNIPARVKIGVLKFNHDFHAHAWVEVCGKPIGEAEDIANRFSILRAA